MKHSSNAGNTLEEHTHTLRICWTIKNIYFFFDFLKISRGLQGENNHKHTQITPKRLTLNYFIFDRSIGRRQLTN